MKKYFRKPFRWAITFTVILAVFTTYVLLDTFIIPRAGVSAAATAAFSAAPAAATAVSGDTAKSSDVTDSTSVVTASSYEDENIKITIETIHEYNTDIYVADIRISSAEYLKTAFAQATYGRNIKDTTSSIAESNQAIFAINGDYYGFRDYGYVIRNGVLYRDTAGDAEDLVIDSLGNFSIIDENQTDANSLIADSAWQVLSFGPALINNGQIMVDENSEVGQSMASNPRTAVGQISALHYVFIVSDGRTSQSAGLSLLELAQVFAARGCSVAYNLDGGGSATLWFNGQVVNNPVNKNTITERSVSDIVYIGY